jgi:predicted TIM-barrel fold metal-dependent hydrolase
MSIIDVHVHIYPPERQYKLLRWIKKSFPEHPVDDKVTPDGIMKDLEDQGISRFINLIYPLVPEETESLNDFNASFCRDHKNAEGFASIHPGNHEKSV